MVLGTKHAVLLIVALSLGADVAESQSRRSRRTRLREAYAATSLADSLRAVRDSMESLRRRRERVARDSAETAARVAAAGRDSADSRSRAVESSAAPASDSTAPTRTRTLSGNPLSARTRAAARSDSGLRIVISLRDRQLWAIIDADTLLSAPIAVSMDESFSYAGRTWSFETPLGIRKVLGKKENPVWTPPDWHYAEVARRHNLKLAAMKPGRTILSDGNWLEVRDSVVGLVDKYYREYASLPTDEEIVFDGTLYIPPMGSINRRIEGELGLHALDLGNGYLLHGTPYKSSIGNAVTHGCIRLHDEDILWLYDMIPVGAKVYIY